MPLRGCVANSAIALAKAMPPNGPAAIFPATANGLFLILHSALWELNTAASFRILAVAMGYMNSKLRMEPKQALNIPVVKREAKRSVQHLPRKQAHHDKGRTWPPQQAGWLLPGAAIG